MAIKQYPKKKTVRGQAEKSEKRTKEEVFAELEAVIQAVSAAAGYKGKAGADGLLAKARRMTKHDERMDPLIDAAQEIKRAVQLLSRIPLQIIPDMMLKSAWYSSQRARVHLQRLPSDHDYPPIPKP